MRLRLVLLACLALALAAAAPSAAWRTTGKQWRTASIGYYNSTPGYDWSVDWAVYVWNASGANVRFFRTTRAKASILIGTKDVPAGSSEAGLADLLYDPSTGYFAAGKVWIRTGLEPYEAALVATHELGHVLGLDHEDRGCAVMNSWLLTDHPSRCRAPAPGRWWCQLLTADDVKGAIRLYGGRLKDPTRPSCVRRRIRPSG